ncbi:hypothetical protein MUK42_36847 [Musa troglodytarum]|uniref:Uncharacterized protein n=1 Tax=Musa troglodytarum TaxID=320322 RepID=A0A9E7II54_9LILI|nr:hypothetical protein MUK42_36847 [Musa troglodytarum]
MATRGGSRGRKAWQLKRCRVVFFLAAWESKPKKEGVMATSRIETSIWLFYNRNWALTESRYEGRKGAIGGKISLPSDGPHIICSHRVTSSVGSDHTPRVIKAVRCDSRSPSLSPHRTTRPSPATPIPPFASSNSGKGRRKGGGTRGEECALNHVRVSVGMRVYGSGFKVKGKNVVELRVSEGL